MDGGWTTHDHNSALEPLAQVHYKDLYTTANFIAVYMNTLHRIYLAQTFNQNFYRSTVKSLSLLN